MANIRTESMDRMFEAILKLKSIDECYAFFEDLCTIRELKDISQRLEVAALLNKGMSYQEVANRTGVSSTTIGRVKRCLEYGSGGYELALGNLEETK